ncbi:MAG: hypothetical protein KBT05_02495, partial [Bacteroidales bacterium]|nr:hypothetical protein [Candidatus Cryptobacteroides caccocaballi]
MMKNNAIRLISMVLACGVLAACSGIHTTSLAGSEGPAVIYPDYKDVTVPINISPLNFHYAMKGVSSASTTFSIGDKSVTMRGAEVEWSLRKWK